MLKVWAPEETVEMGSRIVHVAGDGLAHTDTLCGHVDRTDYSWEDAAPSAKVTCKGCLSVWKFVKGGAL